MLTDVYFRWTPERDDCSCMVSTVIKLVEDSNFAHNRTAAGLLGWSSANTRAQMHEIVIEIKSR